MTTPQKLDRARRMRGDSADKMCKTIGVSRQMWWLWKTGKANIGKTSDAIAKNIMTYIKFSKWEYDF